MITKERYELLKGAEKKGADLAPADYEQIKEYELAHQISRLAEAWVKWNTHKITGDDFAREFSKLFPPETNSAWQRYLKIGGQHESRQY